MDVCLTEWTVVWMVPSLYQQLSPSYSYSWHLFSECHEWGFSSQKERSSHTI